MGMSFSNGWERQRYETEMRSKRAIEANIEKAKRMKLADKIVMVIVDRINQVVVRPGPDPEERECYDMAKEIRDISPELAALIEKVLKVAKDEDK